MTILYRSTDIFFLIRVLGMFDRELYFNNIESEKGEATIGEVSIGENK